jgi:hypothetical protein
MNMNKNNLLARAFLDALGVAVYAVGFAYFVNNAQQWFGPEPGGWLGFAMMIMIFIISACVTGSLVLLKPILLYLEGHKKEAVQLFAYTLLFLIVIVLIISFFVIGIKLYEN